MKHISDSVILANGVKMPCVGLGTWQTTDEVTKSAVLAAFAAGYRHIDTAAAYGSEGGVGAAMKASGLRREEIFVTSKLRNACHGYKSTLSEFEKTLANLGTDYLDLYLVHWPNPVQFRFIWKEMLHDTWRAFEELYKAGRIRAIGVSNFMPHHIDALMEKAEILPMVNQLKLCPGITQPEIVTYCKSRGIALEAYSPFGTGSIFDVPEMQALAAKYGRSIGQICLRWCLQMGFAPLPKSANPMRIFENAQIFDFTLDDTDMTVIANLTGSCGEAPVPDEILF